MYALKAMKKVTIVWGSFRSVTIVWGSFRSVTIVWGSFRSVIICQCSVLWTCLSFYFFLIFSLRELASQFQSN